MKLIEKATILFSPEGFPTGALRRLTVVMALAFSYSCDGPTSHGAEGGALDARGGPPPALGASEVNASLLDELGSGGVALRAAKNPQLKHYIVGFRGSAKEPRGDDQQHLQDAGVSERYYFESFRATSVFATPEMIERLRQSPKVGWVDSAPAGGGGVPQSAPSLRSVRLSSAAGETTGWPWLAHGFDDAYNAGWWSSNSVRIAVIGDGIECALAEITCGPGAAVVQGNPYVDDGSSHETAIASVIAAAVGNGIGIRGGAQWVSLSPILATEPQGGLTCLNAAEAIDIATSPWMINADIVNLSYVFPPGTSCMSLDSAVFGTVVNNAILVVSAGNYAVGELYPPANSPYAIAVTAVTSSMVKWTDASWGSEMDFAAGGKNVPALNYYGSVFNAKGTSIAAPHVAAALALLWEQKIRLEGCAPRRQEALDALINTAVPPSQPPFYQPYYGHGIIDVWGALQSSWMTHPCLEW